VGLNPLVVASIGGVSNIFDPNVGDNLMDLFAQNLPVKQSFFTPIITSTSMNYRMDQNLAIEELRVDIAEARVEKRPLWLVTNVGSCVAVCVYDTVNRCGGMAHVMLPKWNGDANSHPYKYADTAVPALVAAVRKLGGESCSLVAKIAGGASMFSDVKCHLINIGQKNVEAVKKALLECYVPLVAEDTGGNCGRRVLFNASTGVVVVRTIKGGERKL